MKLFYYYFIIIFHAIQRVFVFLNIFIHIMAVGSGSLELFLKNCSQPRRLQELKTIAHKKNKKQARK